MPEYFTINSRHNQEIQSRERAPKLQYQQHIQMKESKQKINIDIYLKKKQQKLPISKFISIFATSKLFPKQL